DRQPAVDLDHQADVVADGPADRGDDALGLVHLFAGHLLPGDAERVELHRAVAAGDDLAGPGGEVVGGAGAAVPAAGLGPQIVAGAAAQQLVDRPAARLADQVPAGDLDAADGGEHGRAALVLVADQPAR